MDKEFQNLIKWMIICLFLGVLAVSSVALARQSRRDGTGRESRTTEKDLQKEQMRQEATQSFPELSDALRGILEKVTKNQRPQPEAVEQARQLLDDNKRNGWAYDDKQKAQFMLLQAWTGFCQDNPVDAVRWSMRACKTNEASQDAWISQALFCVLNDKRPMKPRQEKPRPQSKRRPRRNDNEMASEAKPKPFSEKGVLEFDLMGLQDQVFRQQFDRLKFQAADHSEIEFIPNGETLCVLFWQDDNKPEDTVEMVEKTSREQGEMMGMEMGSSAVPSSDSAKVDLKAQRKYFQMLMEACKDAPEVKFVQMNTARPGNLEQFLNELPDYSGEPIPTVVTAQPDSGAEQFIGWKAEKPFIMIVGAEGKVKYAGTAADFVPAFILTELTGVEIDLEKQNQPAASSQTDIGMMPGMIPHLPTPPQAAKTAMDPNTPVADPNGIVNDPNTPAKTEQFASPSPVAKRSSDFPTQSLEDQLRADNLLRSAQMHIEESRKLRMKNPKKGIEDARQVLKEFPNTESAQQARELLRRVPSRWKERHNITDEELGV